MATDLTLSSHDQLVVLINESNASALNDTHIQFDVPTVLENDPDGMNTGLTVLSKPNGGYVGSVDVKYNRLDLAGFEQYGEPVLTVTEDVTLMDIVSAFNDFYDANLSIAEDVDGSGEIPEIDYVGKALTLNAQSTSLAYRGGIEIILRLESTELSMAIVNTGYKGLEWPALTTELAGNIEFLTPADKALSFMSMSVDGDSAYVFGGDTVSGATSSDLFRYDFTTDTWTTLAGYNSRGGHSSAIVDGRLYIFGGSGVVTSYRFYDIASDTWTNGSQAMPVGLLYASAVAVGRDIYLFNSYSTTNQLWRYNVDDDEFTRLADGGLAGGGGGTYYNGKLYKVGGVPNTNRLYSYDIETDTWTQLANMPYVAGLIQLEVVGDYLYTFGGSVGSSTYSNLLRYDPSTDTWFDYGDIGIGRRQRYGMVNYKDKLYLFGGATTNNYNVSQDTLIRIT